MAAVNVLHTASGVIATGGSHGSIVRIKNTSIRNIYLDVVTATVAGGWEVVATTGTETFELGPKQSLHAISVTGTAAIFVITTYR